MARQRDPDLPKLIDHAGIMREMGVKRATADAILLRIPKVRVPGVSKVYVKRSDVLNLIDENTSYDVVRRPINIRPH